MRKLRDDRKQLYRAEHCKPIVDQIFCRLRKAMQEHILLPSSPFTKAANYALDRENALLIFLEYPTFRWIRTTWSVRFVRSQWVAVIGSSAGRSWVRTIRA